MLPFVIEPLTFTKYVPGAAYVLDLRPAVVYVFTVPSPQLIFRLTDVPDAIFKAYCCPGEVIDTVSVQTSSEVPYTK